LYTEVIARVLDETKTIEELVKRIKETAWEGAEGGPYRFSDGLVLAAGYDSHGRQQLIVYNENLFESQFEKDLATFKGPVVYSKIRTDEHHKKYGVIYDGPELETQGIEREQLASISCLSALKDSCQNNMALQDSYEEKVEVLEKVAS